MSMAIKNIFNLTKVQAKQKKNILLCCAGLIAAGKIFSLIFLFINTSNISFITDINPKTTFLPLVFIPILAMCSTNILTNQELTMYPGTIRTRYISRIITDHLFIVSLYFILLGVNVIADGIICLLRATGLNVGTVFLFDIKYWLIAFAIYVSIGSLVYMLTAVINTLVSVLPNIISIIIAIIIFFAGRYELFDAEALLENIFNFHFSIGMGIGKLVLHAFIVWIVLLTLGIAITFLTKTWKSEFSTLKSFAIYCTNIFIFIFLFSGYIIYNDYNFEGKLDTKTIIIDIPEGIDMNNYPREDYVNSYNLDQGFSTISYDEYKKISSNEINIPDGKVCVNIRLKHFTINNKNLTKRILNNTELDIVNQKLLNTKKEDYYILNNFLGNVYKYTEDYNPLYDYLSDSVNINEIGLLAEIVYK